MVIYFPLDATNYTFIWMFKTVRYANQVRNIAYIFTSEGETNFREVDVFRYVDGLKQGLGVRVATEWQL
jgi:hypothetical protein